ncbi:nitrate ABC transporter permease [Microbacterium mangrovi]|uniref:Nitrate ABC transporter permease n=1 Tax=Microbacterium mangrovi TaxID=1348253 RepID=A0A0B2A0Z1_9MICO|nr:ABC transporter permease subunit [Microbacterium mangrovi]KHK95482.1 nitrate ABC transporter permease [Microbacterium mangrovi]
MSTALRQTLTGIAGVLLALAVWQLAATVGPFADSPLPSATASIAEAAALLATPAMWSATAVTVAIALGGLVVATVIGVVFGVGIGVSPVLLHATRVPLEFLKPIPPIVILPLAVLVLGPTWQMGMFLTVFGCVFAIAMQTSAGVFDTDPVALSTSRSYGMGRGEILGRVVLPSALPYIGTSIRVSAPTSLIIAVVAGLLGGGPGLGQSLLQAQLAGNQPQLFAYVLILGILGLCVQWGSQAAERRMLHWHPQYRKATF